MKFEPVADEVWMFVGDDHQSVATAFIDGEHALLVDSLGSEADAYALRQVLCGDMGKTVRMIACSHFMSDHIAGLPLFADAMIIAHRNHRHTFLSQNRRVDGFYRDPQVVFDSALRIQWGRHQLRFLHNPGKTMDHLSVDVPSADLFCAGDTIVGNIVYLSNADPQQIRTAIGRIQQFGRGTVIGGHIGRFGGDVLANAIHYLDHLRQRVVAIHGQAEGGEAADLVASITLESCLPAAVVPVAFER